MPICSPSTSITSQQWLEASQSSVASIRPVEWLRPDGAAMRVEDWHARGERALMLYIGEPDDLLLLLFNAGDVGVEFVLPAGDWTVVLASTDGHRHGPGRVVVVMARRS
jgi:pullulanase/glycogen debranching enzyme